MNNVKNYLSSLSPSSASCGKIHVVTAPWSPENLGIRKTRSRKHMINKMLKVFDTHVGLSISSGNLRKHSLLKKVAMEVRTTNEP
ncbi:hypothetical protein SOVF_202810 [Spinacia oleracea]|nr:hypothetical protein SOVF_202810 [Spinacia oleracea]